MPAGRDDSLRDCEDFGVGLRLPRPLSARLDVLVELVEATGDTATRKEVIAALVLGAPASGPALGEMVREYRRARVSDAMIPGYAEERFLNPERLGPGRRRRTP